MRAFSVAHRKGVFCCPDAGRAQRRSSVDGAITDVPGLLVGHWTDLEAVTGCTVVLSLQGAVGGVDVRGAAPGTRETDLLRPANLVQQVHAILLSGGSAFGLDAASGVMRYLEERNIGFPTRVARVPIVPAAILFDLAIGSATVRPDAAAGYQACLVAAAGAVAEGSVGAGAGATVGKALGMEHATKGGIGTASRVLSDGVVVGALVAVNAFGDVVDPRSGQVVAGPRHTEGRGFVRTTDILTLGRDRALAVSQETIPTNTTIGVVATNARLSKEQVNRLAQMAHDGLSWAVRPAHTMGDGDLIFALATGEVATDQSLTVLGTAAAEAVAEAILRGVTRARSLGGVPAVDDLER
ncbi:MAG: P1 family peptidase [Chloroflexi bacterium]|nr:P1 family peptidase [Chloroflexota bacterium]